MLGRSSRFGGVKISATIAIHAPLAHDPACGSGLRERLEPLSGHSYASQTAISSGR
jgi:hypothetical protein